MGAKPPEVSRAVILLWVSLAVMPLRMAADWNTTKAVLDSTFVVTVLATTIFLLSFLIWNISQGKNWARLVFLVLYLLGLPFSLYALPADFGRSAIVGVCSIAQIVLQGAGLWLTSRPPGKDWFTDPRPEASLPSIRA
jgi:cell division protein FtsW (lipid II flippase)